MNNMTITIGRYVKGDSYLYRIDPRLKIIGTIILMVVTFIIPATGVNSLYVLLGFLAILLAIMLIGRINFLSFLKGLQPIVFIAVLTFILQIAYNKDGNVVTTFNLNFSWLTITIMVLLVLIYFATSKFFRLKFLYFLFIFILAFIFLNLVNVNTFNQSKMVITSDGLIKAAFYSLRIVIAVTISTILTISTSSMDINLSLEWLLHPLTYIKFPVATLAMMFSLTLRFIPTLTIEADKILKAQASRGIDFNEGNILEKIKQITTLLVPMFALSITKAEDLANAMEVRGYIVGAKRTSVEELKFKRIDLFSTVFLILMLSLAIVSKILL